VGFRDTERLKRPSVKLRKQETKSVIAKPPKSVTAKPPVTAKPLASKTRSRVEE
jgi:hypothetical protein